MQYALISGDRTLPEPGLRGSCLRCGQETVAKCGTQKLWHWSHLGQKHCDPWWENETAWHRSWKEVFPEQWREVVHFDPNTGEKHVADVKTARGLVIELQHSHMSLDELRSRETFYKRMIWIVDGRSFTSQFKVLPERLPNPNSKLLDEIVFCAPNARAYQKRSEIAEGSGGLIEVHRSSTIEPQIRADYRGHHFFTWKRAREVWFSADTPVFIDFGTEELIRLMKYTPASQRCVQRISKQALIEKNVRSSSSGT
jgi:hypothetical protein